MASESVTGFTDFKKRFEEYLTVAGRAESTYRNYLHQLARLALHFDTIPTALDPVCINEYLYLLSKQLIFPSSSYFKHTVYGLRAAYRAYGIADKVIFLPSFRKEKKLPVVLSKREMKLMLENPKSLKHKMLLAMLYGCGLRLSEIRNLKLSDVDFDRRTVYIRQGKSKKDRYVPLSELLIESLRQYIQSYTPKYWLFFGKKTRFYKSLTARYSPKGINWVLKHNAGAVGITKEISAHTFRHTYATHLLEDGLDIVTIKELLGHSKIETTMVYLHVAQYDKNPVFSPIDTLYGLRKKGQNFQCPYAQYS